MNPTPSESRIPVVLKCRGTADFIAALPHMTGFTATDSVFLVIFTGNRATRALRVDLPDEEGGPAAEALLDFLEEAVRHGPPEERDPAIVLATRRSFAECGGTPYRRLAARVERRLLRDGVRLRELCCVARDGWASYLDPDSPPGGNPLSAITESRVAAPPIEASVRRWPSLTELGELPEPEPSFVRAVARACETEPVGWGADWGEHRLTEWIAVTGETSRALLIDDQPLAPADAARIAQRCADPGGWLVLALCVLTRPGFPSEVCDEIPPRRLLGMPADSPRPEVSIRDLLAFTAARFSEHDRLRVPQARLLTVVSAVPTQLRPGALALSAWLWWLYGLQSVARKHLRLGTAIAPGHEMLGMVSRLISRPAFPEAWQRAGRDLAGERRHDSRDLGLAERLCQRESHGGLRDFG